METQTTWEDCIQRTLCGKGAGWNEAKERKKRCTLCSTCHTIR